MISGLLMSPPWIMASQPSMAVSTSGRSSPWVSDNTAIRFAISFTPILFQSVLPQFLRIQRPAVVTMVDHKPGLTAVDADVFAGDETGFVGSQEQHHVGDV